MFRDSVLPQCRCLAACTQPAPPNATGRNASSWRYDVALFGSHGPYERRHPMTFTLTLLVAPYGHQLRRRPAAADHARCRPAMGPSTRPQGSKRAHGGRRLAGDATGLCGPSMPRRNLRRPRSRPLPCPDAEPRSPRSRTSPLRRPEDRGGTARAARPTIRHDCIRRPDKTATADFQFLDRGCSN